MVRILGVGLGAVQILSGLSFTDARTVKTTQVAQTNLGPPGWVFAGCYVEGTGGRALPYQAATLGGPKGMNVLASTTACQLAGYLLSGLEDASQCFCSNSITHGGVLASDGLTSCNKPCKGNASEFCGGSKRLNVYNFQNTVPLPPYGAVVNPSSSSKVSSTSKSSSTSKISSTSAKSSTLTSNISKSSSTSKVTSSSSVPKSSILSTSSTLRSSSSSTLLKSSSATSTSAKSSMISTTVKSSSTSKISSTPRSSATSSNTSKSSSTSKSTSSSLLSTLLSSVKLSSSQTLSASIVSSASIKSSTFTSSQSVSSSQKSSASSTKSSSTISSILLSSQIVSSSQISSISSSLLSSATSSTPSSQVVSSSQTSSVFSTSLSSASSLTPSAISSIQTSSSPIVQSSVSSTISSIPSSSSIVQSTSSQGSSIPSVSSSTGTFQIASSSVLSSLSTSSSQLSGLSSLSTFPSSSLSQSSKQGSSTASIPTSTSSVQTSSVQSSVQSSLSAAVSSSVYQSSLQASSTVPVFSSTSLTPISSLQSSVLSSFSAAASSNIPQSSIVSVPTSTAPSAAISSTQIIMSSTVLSSASSTPSPTLTANTIIPGWSFVGCFTEATAIRALSMAAHFNYVGMTLGACAADCVGYTFFGVEYGGECYCGNTLNTGSVQAPLTDCSFICPGNPYEYCGAGNRLELYQVGTFKMSTTSSVVSSAAPTLSALTISSLTVSAPTLSTSTLSTTSTSAQHTPTGWQYEGCWVDGNNGRILGHQQPDNLALTQESCISICAGLGYSLAGMEWSIQCFCDSFVYNGGAPAINQADCSMPCGGNATEKCGARGRLSLFSSNSPPQVYEPPAAQVSNLPANWKYVGCLQDNIPSLQNAAEIISTFPYMVWNDATSNTPTACIEQCQTYGFNAAGLEYGSECYCGDVENIQVASAPGVSTNPNDVQNYIYSTIPQIVPDSHCNSVCSGNASYLCGSGNLMSYYAWNSSTPLYSFGEPTGPEAGEYSLLIGGVVVPLIVSQVVTGKVLFTEKYGSGEPNGTGAYELDLSEINNFTAAWRPLTGLQTDVFCSAGLTLPDKAGRQITIGGWAGQSNFGVRLYWPDGSPGVPGVNDWQEDPTVLSLQVPRWYASAMIMANGSMLIGGGEIGSNAAAQPTLEIFPATGVPDSTTVTGYSNTTVYLSFLAATAPFNLYPFICVLPTGGIFIGAYNEARILDETTFEVLKTLPNMPGAVNDPTGGRTYQLEGSMVLLPQHAPYTDHLEVLICGGSTSDGGYALDNCITTAPEDPEPVWTIERMPSRRVMPCMAGLPDGTYLILNGGQHGVAGFGLGGDPNINVVLYDPSQPHNSRMNIMANTSVARLYHSEATLLVDGRVLVSGSDPSGDYIQAAGSWPEEYRVEVFTPPYLLSGLPRPTFALSSTDWDYGESVVFTVTSGSTANLKVSMLGSVVSTHGNSMGQRTIFPDVVCAGNTCIVDTPPNAHVAPPGWFMFFVLDGPTPSVGQFVRIGKDPANMGDWPQDPKFTIPGTG